MRKISGPLLDRIDVFARLGPVRLEEMRRPSGGVRSEALRAAVARAREAQSRRLGPGRTNADMDEREVRRFAVPGPAALRRLEAIGSRLELSARGYVRVLKVARTLADLDGRREVAWEDLARALHYRHRPVGAGIGR